MRLTDDRYAGERSQFELALRMIRHEARTRTIRECTGLSDDRIRKLYSTYFRNSGQAEIKRRRGKSPRQVQRYRKESAKSVAGDDPRCALLRRAVGADRQGQSGPPALAATRRRIRAPPVSRLRDLPAAPRRCEAEFRVGMEPVALYRLQRRIVPGGMRPMRRPLRPGCLCARQ